MELEGSDAFTVDVSDGSLDKRCKNLEKHFAKYKKISKSKDEIALKQQAASERKKAHQAAKLERIKQRSDDCLKIKSKVQALLAQDAKHQGMPGTEHIKPMSSREVVKSIKDLKKDFDKLHDDLFTQDYNIHYS